MVQNRPITVVMGCADLTYSYISREVRSEGFPTEANILEFYAVVDSPKI